MRLRSVCILSAVALAAGGCKTLPAVGEAASGAYGAPTPVASSAPGPVTGPGGCTYLPGTEPRQQVSQQNMLIGAAIGAAAGALVGRNAADRRSVGTRNGLLLGALAGALAGSQFKDEVKVSETSDGLVKVNIPGSVLFPTGRSDLNPQFRQTLDSVTDSIRNYCGVTAVVVGHTDNTGTPAINERLSMERAVSVVNHIAPRFGRDRLSAEGRAEREPVASNADANGRALNRRVEIFVRAPSPM